MKKKKHDESLVNIVGNLALIGSGAIALSSVKPLIIGRETMYHGTNPDLVSKIKKEGIINPIKRGVGEQNTYNYNPKNFNEWGDPLNHVYAGNKKSIAKTFVKFNNRGVFNNRGIIEVGIPRWKSEYKKQPYSFQFKEISPEYIKGSKKYIPFYKELGQYIKAKPGKFALGAGLGLAGASAVGLGIKNIVSNKEHSKEAAYNAGFEDELNKIASPVSVMRWSQRIKDLITGKKNDFKEWKEKADKYVINPKGNTVEELKEDLLNKLKG